MKLLITVCLIHFGHCLKNYDHHYKSEERQISRGSRYGGLTDYDDGTILVKQREISQSFGYSQYYDYEPQRYNDKNERQRYYNKDTGRKEDDINIKDDKVNKYEEGYDSKDGYEGNCIGYYKRRLGYGNRDRYGREGYGNRDGIIQEKLKSDFSNYYDEETRKRCDDFFGYTGPTANDEPENLIRPCALEDWQCIRNFFAANSKCKPAYGPIPDPVYIGINTVFYPVVNLTAVLTNLRVRGLSGAKMREFYVNKQSGNLVFAIDIPVMTESIPRTYLRYRRTGMESIILADYGTVQFGVTFTAVIPKVPNLRLELADIHAHVQDAVFPIFIGPGGYNSTDPDVVSAFAQFNLLIPIIAREGLFFRSQLLTATYIQKNICDFGLKLISV